MEKRNNHDRIKKTGAFLILIGALSIFPENDTWMHTTLQITFFAGCIVFLYGNRAGKKSVEILDN